jgi:hypothetical protein
MPLRERPSIEERAGPLLVERHRKTDGRPLLLYWEAPGDSEAAGEPEARTTGNHKARATSEDEAGSDG